LNHHGKACRYQPANPVEDNDPDAWLSALTQLIEDAERRRAMGAGRPGRSKRTAASTPRGSRGRRGEALSLGAPSKYLAGEVSRRPAGALRRGSAGRCKGWRIPLGIRTRVVHGPVSSDHQRGRFHRTVSERERAPVQASCLSRCGGRVTKTVTTGRDSPLSRGPRRCTVSRAATRFFSQSITAQRGIVSFPAGCRRFAPGRPLL
jgi:hypothetical protein